MNSYILFFFQGFQKNNVYKVCYFCLLLSNKKVFSNKDTQNKRSFMGKGTGGGLGKR